MEIKTDKTHCGDMEGVCPHCCSGVGLIHFCSQCNKIQPVPHNADYYTFFDIPLKFHIDEPELEKKFYSLSRQFHPDYYMNASEEERQASIERSSMLNDAFRTLRDNVSRAQYILSLEGIAQVEKKAPPELLEEVFDLNMEIEELKAARNAGDEDEAAALQIPLVAALSNLEKKTASMDEELSGLFREWDSAPDAVDLKNGELIFKIKEILSHRSYLSNLIQIIKEIV